MIIRVALSAIEGMIDDLPGKLDRFDHIVRTPAESIDSIEGQRFISKLLAKVQSGAYMCPESRVLSSALRGSKFTRRLQKRFA